MANLYWLNLENVRSLKWQDQFFNICFDGNFLHFMYFLIRCFAFFQRFKVTRQVQVKSSIETNSISTVNILYHTYNHAGFADVTNINITAHIFRILSMGCFNKNTTKDLVTINSVSLQLILESIQRAQLTTLQKIRGNISIVLKTIETHTDPLQQILHDSTNWIMKICRMGLAGATMPRLVTVIIFIDIIVVRSLDCVFEIQ